MVALARPTADREPCVLCEAPAAVRGVFIPHDQAAVQAPAGKTRGVVYYLCGRCHRRPDAPARVEALILADFAATTPAAVVKLPTGAG